MFKVIKTYGPEQGWSCAFRQWRAESHCRFIHGYALSFSLTFGCDDLDARNWVIDFGGLKPVKAVLADLYDHRLVIAEDDPQKRELFVLGYSGIADPRLAPAIGCEAFALETYVVVSKWLLVEEPKRRVRLMSVECREHSGNAAVYEPSVI